MREANRIVLIESELFREAFSEKLLLKTVPIIQEMRCTPEEIIFNEGQLDDHAIYFIEKGSVEIFVERRIKKNYKEKRILEMLSKGRCFGQQHFFDSSKRDFSVRSVGFTTLLKIK